VRYPPVDISGLDDTDLDVVAGRLAAGDPEPEVHAWVIQRQAAHLLDTVSPPTRNRPLLARRSL
jgi:hypothetical protein